LEEGTRAENLQDSIKSSSKALNSDIMLKAILLSCPDDFELGAEMWS
jgi:hypothetical protein